MNNYTIRLEPFEPLSQRTDHYSCNVCGFTLASLNVKRVIRVEVEDGTADGHFVCIPCAQELRTFLNSHPECTCGRRIRPSPPYDDEHAEDCLAAYQRCPECNTLCPHAP